MKNKQIKMKTFYILIMVIINFDIAIAQNWTAVDGGTNAPVYSLIEYNGDLIVGGNFISAGGNTVDYVAKWNDYAWTSMGLIPNVNAVECSIVYNNELYAGGGMGLAKWNGSSWVSHDQGGWFDALAVYNNQIYYTKEGIIKKWNTSGPIDTIIGTTNSDPTEMIVYNGELIVSGNYSDINGTPFNNIAKWNGTSWSSLGIGLLMSGASAMATYNGELYVGGGFQTSGGNIGNFIQKWNGSNWLAVGSGASNGVSEIDSIDGKLYIGGFFDSISGVSAKHIAYFDGNTWFAMGSGLNNYPMTIKKYNGNIYAGGAFTMAGGNLTFYIAKWGVSTGIIETEFDNFKFKLFPNPATNNLTVRFDQIAKKCTLTILNINGQEIIKQSIKESNTQIDITNLTNGVYFAKLMTDKTVEVRKIIKE